MGYKWNSPKQVNTLKDILDSILKWKGISKENIRNFLDCNITPHDPFLLTNMNKAIHRINLAIQNNENILVIGDYDCDGVSSTAVLYIGLQHLYSNVFWRVPHRVKDGYGISNHLIKEAYSQKINLIITVDNGIAAHDPIKYAHSLGIDVIVTDHHQLTSLGKPTEITINPHLDDSYPFKGICGCMVAFKLVNALIPNLAQVNNSLYNELVSITAIATIADVMEIVDENRFYVKYGLALLKNCENLGLRTLINHLDLNNKIISVDNVGYLIAPCINASGRLESADIAVNLLLSEDFVEANKLSRQIIELNNKRKEIQRKIIDNVSINPKDPFVVISLDNIEHGIIGIIAGEISGKYQKPCFVLTQKGDTLSGSGRSIEGYNIYSIIENNRDFISGGGHAGACGISIKPQDFNKLKQICIDDFHNWLNDNNIIGTIEPSIEAVCEIPLEIINERLIHNINKLQPYGHGNKEPLFISRNVNVDLYRAIVKNTTTLILDLSQLQTSVKAIGFKNIYDIYQKVNYPQTIDIIYAVNLNEWPIGSQNFTIQLIIKDLKPHQQ